MIDKKKLFEIARKRLLETEEDDWSFVIETAGAESFSFYPWSSAEEWDWEGDAGLMRGVWRQERLVALEKGEAEPTEEELAQWQRALAAWLADGTDWSWFAWIVPIWIDGAVEGYATFVGNGWEDSTVAPTLLGVTDSFELALGALKKQGAVIE